MTQELKKITLSEKLRLRAIAQRDVNRRAAKNIVTVTNGFLNLKAPKSCPEKNYHHHKPDEVTSIGKVLIVETGNITYAIDDPTVQMYCSGKDHIACTNCPIKNTGIKIT